MMVRVFCILMLSVVTGSVWALSPAAANRLDIANAQLHNLTATADGFLANVGSDGYLTFRGLDLRRDQACGITLDLEFRTPLERPGIFEFFWRSAEQGFAEQRKAFVIINQADTLERHKFMIPLCKLYHYSGNLNLPERQARIEGLRLDYPANKDIELKFHAIDLLSAVEMNELIRSRTLDPLILEPYERVSANSFTSFDVALPKFYFAFEEGLHRLGRDKAFLVVWLVMIIGLLLLMLRSVLRQKRL